MIKRLINLSKSNSFFIFGPRGVGKTTYLQARYQDNKALYINLLDPQTYDEFLLRKERFIALINSNDNKDKLVIIDEVQKLPQLLDYVHLEIQKSKRQFILTGSSSRKLKQQGVNLLAGRAWIYELFPFSTFEMGESFELKKCLEFGALPEAFLAKTKEDSKGYFNAYTGTYLQKEIQEECWVRNLGPFRKFLAVAAQMNGKLINKSAIAREVGVDDVTIANYFEILEDTLIGFHLPAFHQSVRKAQRQAAKFYFIDPGMKRALEKTLSVELLPQTSAWGEAFEHWILLEIKKGISYGRLDWELSYLRTKDDLEIDLIIDRPGAAKLLIEIKSKDKVIEHDARALEMLGPDLDPGAERWLLSTDPLEQRFGQTRALHWRKALEELFF